MSEVRTAKSLPFPAASPINGAWRDRVRCNRRAILFLEAARAMKSRKRCQVAECVVRVSIVDVTVKADTTTRSKCPGMLCQSEDPLAIVSTDKRAYPAADRQRIVDIHLSNHRRPHWDPAEGVIIRIAPRAVISIDSKWKSPVVSPGNVTKLFFLLKANNWRRIRRRYNDGRARRCATTLEQTAF